MQGLIQATAASNPAAALLFEPPDGAAPLGRESKVRMYDQPDGREEIRAELDRLRAEMRDLRDDLDHHLMVCPGSLQAAQESIYGA